MFSKIHGSSMYLEGIISENDTIQVMFLNLPPLKRLNINVSGFLFKAE